jgi:hypothetical protein
LISQQMAYSASPKLGQLLAARVGRWENTRGLSAQYQGRALAQGGRLHTREQSGSSRWDGGLPRSPLMGCGAGLAGSSACLCRSWAEVGVGWG